MSIFRIFAGVTLALLFIWSIPYLVAVIIATYIIMTGQI